MQMIGHGSTIQDADNRVWQWVLQLRWTTPAYGKKPWMGEILTAVQLDCFSVIMSWRKLTDVGTFCSFTLVGYIKGSSRPWNWKKWKLLTTERMLSKHFLFLLSHLRVSEQLSVCSIHSCDFYSLNQVDKKFLKICLMKKKKNFHKNFYIAYFCVNIKRS